MGGFAQVYLVGVFDLFSGLYLAPCKAALSSSAVGKAACPDTWGLENRHP